MRRSEPDNREPRHPYSGPIRLLIPFEPWKLAMTLRGLDLSATGVAGYLPKEESGLFARLGPRLSEAEIDALLVTGDPYDLQLEHEEPHLAAPVVPTRLVRRVKTRRGLELGFRFEVQDPDVLSLVHELGQS